MLQTTAVHRGACRQTTFIHQLDAAVAHHCRGRVAINALHAAAVDQGAGRFPGGRNDLISAIVQAGTGRRARHHLFTTAKDSAIRRRAAEIDVLQTAAVYSSTCRQAAVIHQLDAAIAYHG